VRADVDGQLRGMALYVGAMCRLKTIDLTAGALLGTTMGAYAGGELPLTRGRIAPVISAGVPLFFAEGRASPGLELSAGVRWSPARGLSITAGLGGAWFPFAVDYEPLAVLYRLGVSFER
jgi:hypothetical protein